MSIFKCKMCGGTIEFEPGATVGVCDSCGTKQTLPRLDDDRKANLYDRANHFRRNNDFDKAMAIYEQILNEDNTDAEAYWSLVLCRYGIEYVEDPASHKRVPTVNRAQFTSIFADEDYKAAIQHADGYQKAIYEAEARAIDEIQKGILAISQKEEPFDVFICYKETDANGRRTQDSVLANDLYHQLTQEGFKVFFSRITLEDKLGTAYEPYIFAALNSAKVMVVLGTKPENFNAVWVKNEWSRYLALIRSGAKKTLIPAYRDMDPYDLPEEFSHLMAQDMSKLGFMQDLLRGIKKIIGADTPKAPLKETVVISGSSTNNIAPLLKRAFMFLEDGDWQRTDDFCEQVLNQDPENAQAYLGKLMAELHVRKQEHLQDCDKPFDHRNNYQKTLRFAEPALKETLERTIKHINDRNENARLKGIYDGAVRAMQGANTEAAYKSAAESFRTIQGFQDAEKKAEECRIKAEICRKDAIYASAKASMTGSNDGYEKAIELFRKISGWKDADELVDSCRRKIEEIKAKEEADRIAAEKAAQKKKRTAAIMAALVCACIAGFILTKTVIIPGNKYNAAVALLDEGKIIEAYESLVVLNGYKDSAAKANEIYAQYKNEKLKVAEEGDIVFFGTYEQDNNTTNGKEDVEWLVLDKKDGKILVISKYALDCQKYHSSFTDITWEKCSLRKWMNGTFLNNAFSVEEQKQIQNTTVSADKNPKYSTDPGKATTDKVFLLSITEAEKYFKTDASRKCAPTAYAKAQGASTSDSNKTASGAATCWWWLRSPGLSQHCAAYVSDGGSLYCFGDYVTEGIDCVRPALWINLDS